MKCTDPKKQKQQQKTMIRFFLPFKGLFNQNPFPFVICIQYMKVDKVQRFFSVFIFTGKQDIYIFPHLCNTVLVQNWKKNLNFFLFFFSFIPSLHGYINRNELKLMS